MAEHSPNGPHPPPPYEINPPSRVRPRPTLPLDLPVLNAVRSKRTILASASPRRRQLLAQVGLNNIEIIPSKFAEDIPKDNLSAFEYVLQTASAKAMAVYRSQLHTSADKPMIDISNTISQRDASPLLPKLPSKEPELIIAADTIIVGPHGAILEKPRNEKHHLEMLRLLRDGLNADHLASQRKFAHDRTSGPQTSGGLGIGAEWLELGDGMRGEGAGVSNTVLQARPSQRDNTDGSIINEGQWHKVLTAVAVLAPLESCRDPGYTMATAVEETSVQFATTISDELLQAYVKTREGADKAGGYGIQGMGGLLIERINGTWDNVVGLPIRKTLQLLEKAIKDAADDDDDDDDDGQEDDNDYGDAE